MYVAALANLHPSTFDHDTGYRGVFYRRTATALLLVTQLVTVHGCNLVVYSHRRCGEALLNNVPSTDAGERLAPVPVPTSRTVVYKN